MELFCEMLWYGMAWPLDKERDLSHLNHLRLYRIATTPRIWAAMDYNHWNVVHCAVYVLYKQQRTVLRTNKGYFNTNTSTFNLLVETVVFGSEMDMIANIIETKWRHNCGQPTHSIFYAYGHYEFVHSQLHLFTINTQIKGRQGVT